MWHRTVASARRLFSASVGYGVSICSKNQRLSVSTPACVIGGLLRARHSRVWETATPRRNRGAYQDDTLLVLIVHFERSAEGMSVAMAEDDSILGSTCDMSLHDRLTRKLGYLDTQRCPVGVPFKCILFFIRSAKCNTGGRNGIRSTQNTLNPKAHLN